MCVAKASHSCGHRARHMFGKSIRNCNQVQVVVRCSGRDSLCKLLEEHGYQILEARNSQDALAISSSYTGRIAITARRDR
jgi:hypothetical protein